MRVCLIGGSGVLSRDVLARCVELGYNMTVINRGNRKVDYNVPVILADIRNTQDVNNKLKDMEFDVVVDFVSYNQKQLENTFSIFENKCKQYIFISSCCVYRRDPSDFPIIEESPKPNGQLPYGMNKLECEQFLQKRPNRCHYTIVRPYITYGDTRIPFALAPLAGFHGTIIKRVINNKPLFIWKENGHIPTCTLTHTKDFAIGFCGLLLNEEAYDTDINIVGDDRFSWLDIVKQIYNCLGKSSLPIPEIPIKNICDQFPNDSQFFLGDRNLDAIFDNSKIKRLVPEFKSSISLENGLYHTIQYYKDNCYLDGIDYIFDAKLDRLLKSSGLKNVGFVDYMHNADLFTQVKYLLYSNFHVNTAHGIEYRLKKLLKSL